MILDYKTINYKGSVLFSWITLETPTAPDLMIPPDACVAYISEGDGHHLFAQELIIANPQSVIVSACGRTVENMIAKQEVGKLSTIIAHFRVEQLKDIYKDSKPKLWKELDKPLTKFVTQEAASNLIISYFEGIEHFFTNQQAVSDDILALKIQELVLLLLQSGSSQEIRTIINSLFSEKQFSFKEIIESYLFMPITIDGLAMLTNKSVSSFKREFKKYTNYLPEPILLKKELKELPKN